MRPDDQHMSDQPRHFLKEWRAQAGLTQGQVAEGIGYERSYYSRIENSKRGYDQEILERLAALYHCTAAELIGRDPATTEPLWGVVRRLPASDLIRLTEIAKTLEGVSAAS
jgi:transcriptional regulator with XRE-family HTH domain